MTDHKIVAGRLHLKLFGSPRQFLAGEEVAGFTSSKVQALLYYLAVTRQAHRRTTLASLLWPNASSRNAGNSLRNALSSLRKLFPDCLNVERHAVALYEQKRWLDTEEFGLLLADRNDDPVVAMQQRQAAVSLYVGEFLSGFHVDGAPEFEQWAVNIREHLHLAMVDTLMVLAQWYSMQMDDVASLDAVSRLLALAPGNEAAHRHKMQVLARGGQREAAILQFDILRRYLSEELGIDPSPETAALYARLLEGDHGIDERSTASAMGIHVAAAHEPGRVHHLDPGDMPGRTQFLGRFHQLAELTDSLLEKRGSLVVVTGMGGVGKTALATELVFRVAELPPSQAGFSRIVWRSLVNAPTLNDLLDDWLRVLTQSSPESQSTSLDAKLERLFAILAHERVLLILDNVESVMEAGDGGFRTGYEPYQQLLARMAHGHHRSCLLITSREAPNGVERMASDYPRVTHLPLLGLSLEQGIALMRARGLIGGPAALRSLVAHYSGNPLALKLVASAVTDVYAGDADAFLTDGVQIFNDVRSVLEQQIERLSETARELLVWLTINREPVGFDELEQDMVMTPTRRELLEAIRLLRRSSLLQDMASQDRVSGLDDRQVVQWAVHNLVMEYVSDYFLAAVQLDIRDGNADFFHRYALSKAAAPEYVQAAQGRLFRAPLAQWLILKYGITGARRQLRKLLHHARQDAVLTNGYTGANVLHLMLELSPDLQGEDFSGLSLRQADLRSASLVDVDMRDTDLSNTRFADSFGIVSSVAVSPDGSFLAAGAGRVVVVWHRQTLQPHMIFEKHTRYIAEVAFAADGVHLASAGQDGTILIWNVATGSLVNQFQMDVGDLISMAFSRNGELLVGGGYNGRIAIWDWQRGEPLGYLAPNEPVVRLAFAPTGELLANIGYHGEIQAWDLDTQSIVYTLRNGNRIYDTHAAIAVGRSTTWANQGGVINGWDQRTRELNCQLHGHETWVSSLALAPDEKHIASADADGKIIIWDAKTGQPFRFLDGHQGSARGLTYTPDGRHLISGGYDETIRIWNVRSGLEEKRLQGHLRWVHQLEFSPNGQHVAGVTLVGTVYLWHRHDLSARHTLSAHRTAVRTLAFSADGQQLATGGDDGTVIVWDVQSGKQRHLFRGHQRYARAVVFDHTGRYLVSSGYDNTIHVWDVDLGRLHHTIPQTSVNTMHGITFHPHQSLLAYGDTSNHIYVWAVDTGQVVASVMMKRRPKVVAFSPDGRYLACGSFDGAVTIWEFYSDGSRFALAEHCEIRPSEQCVWRMSFNSDGSLLAWNGERREIYVASVRDGKLRYSVDGAHLAECFIFSADGRTLVADGSGSVICVYDALTGDEIKTLRGHTSNLTSIVAGPDASMIASSDAGGAIRLWDAHMGKELASVGLSSPYSGMNIQGATGLTSAQRRALVALGAVS